MTKRPLILVHWLDIAADSLWHDEGYLDDCTPIDCYSVGWRMPSGKTKDGKRFIRLAPTRSDYKRCADVITIPLGCIQSIRRIKEDAIEKG